MKLLINYKNKYDNIIFELYKKNSNYDSIFTPEYTYNIILSSDMWFILVNENDDIIAECSSEITTNNNFSICDVFVEEKFRGNNYAELLLINILYHFDILNIHYNYSIVAHIDNIPAVKTYTKIFGKPICNNGYANFNYSYSS
jgi:hypothetical protein